MRTHIPYWLLVLLVCLLASCAQRYDREEGSLPRHETRRPEVLRPAMPAPSVDAPEMRMPAVPLPPMGEQFMGMLEPPVAPTDRHETRRHEQRMLGMPRPEPGPSHRLVPPEAKFAVLRIFYATDRELQPSEPLTFTSARNPGGTLTLGTLDVSIPRQQHHRGHLERPSIWRFEFREDRTRHFVIVESTVKSESVFYTELAGRVRLSEGKQALVFVHGYNVSFDDAAYRTAQLSYDLGLDAVPILYSWPSNGTALDYIPDMNNCEWSIDHLHSFLKDFVARSQAANIYLIAHSIGNRALVGALARLAAEASFTPRAQFTHVVLTAPDIDAGMFRQTAAAITKTARRTTLYASSNDRALQLSKRLHGYQRAGESAADILVFSGIDTIDVSSVDTDLIGHSYYAANSSVLSDMFYLLRGQTPPRFGLREAIAGSIKYWIFAP